MSICQFLRCKQNKLKRNKKPRSKKMLLSPLNWRWDAGHQTLRKKAEAREKRNTGDAPLQAALQTAGHTAARRAGGGQGPSPGPGLETVSLAPILMREGAGTGQAAALPMAPEENEAEVVPGVEGSPIELSVLGPKAEQEGPGQDLVHVPIVEAVKDPVIEELVVGQGTETDVKYGTKRKEKRRRTKARTKKFTVSNVAKADEALKAKERNEEEAKRRKEEDQATLVEQVKRVKEIEAIESDSFIQQTFRSSKEVKKSVEPSEVKHVTPASGPTSVAADPPSVGKEIDPDSIPTAIKYQDDNSLAHPNLFIEKAEAEEKWFKRLIALRQERLMGSPVA